MCLELDSSHVQGNDSQAMILSEMAMGECVMGPLGSFWVLRFTTDGLRNSLNNSDHDSAMGTVQGGRTFIGKTAGRLCYV